jgi:DNA repair and recombination protein RAD52
MPESPSVPELSSGLVLSNGLSQEQIDALKEPLAKGRIKKRTDRGKAFNYIEGYDVIDRANEIFGFDGWGYRVLGVAQVATGTYTSNGKEKPWALIEASVEVWLTSDPTCRRVDVGHGQAHPADSIDTLEMQRKGAVTDALKRALRTFGNQFGNELYDKDRDQRDERQPAAPRGQSSQPAPAQRTPIRASDAQVNLIRGLLKEAPDAVGKGLCGQYEIGYSHKEAGTIHVENADKLTGGREGTASQMITALQLAVKATKEAAPAVGSGPALTGGRLMEDPRTPTRPPTDRRVVAPPAQKPLEPASGGDGDTQAPAHKAVTMDEVFAHIRSEGMDVEDVAAVLECEATETWPRLVKWVQAEKGRTVKQLLEMAKERKAAATPAAT